MSEKIHLDFHLEFRTSFAFAVQLYLAWSYPLRYSLWTHGNAGGVALSPDALTDSKANATTPPDTVANVPTIHHWNILA